MLPREAGDVNLERHRANGRPEVVQADLANTEPVGQVARVRHRRGQADDAQLAAGPVRDEVGARDYDLEHGPAVLAQQVDLVDDHQAHVANEVPGLPAATHAVPLLRSRYDDVRVTDHLQK